MTEPRIPLAFYGSLRVGGGALDRLGLAGRLAHAGPCRLRGRLHAVSWYPGLVEGTGVVHGDLFTLVDPGALAVLDEYEGYRVDDPEGSVFARSRVRLIEPDVEAWTYVWNGATDGCPLIASGDWLDHQARSGR